MLPTPRRQEEEAAEAGSLLSLQAVAAAAAAAAQPLPGAAGEPLRPNPTLEWQADLEESDQNFASGRCSAHSWRQLGVTSCGAVLWELRELDARDRRLGNGICLLAWLFSGEVRVGCGQVETAPEYIPFLC